MKLFATLFTTLILSYTGLAQQNDIEIFEKKDGNTNLVMARNTGKVSYKVTVEINAKGMDVTPSMKVEAIIPAGYMKEMARLTPKPGEAWSYGYDVSFIEYTGEIPKTTSTPTPIAASKPTPASSSKTGTTATATVEAATPKPAATNAPTQESLSSAPIIVYAQAGCGRCSYVKKEMNTKGIKFVEIDVNVPSAEVNNMWAELRDGGFTGNSVTMPVVRVNGEFHYNIKDLPGFVANLK